MDESIPTQLHRIWPVRNSPTTPIAQIGNSGKNTTEMPRVAHQAVTRILETDIIRMLDVEPSLVDRAIEQCQKYDDQSISLTDHVIAVQAADYGIDHILTYDDGFRTLGDTTLPRE